MARYYLSTMDVLYRLSIWVAGIALIIMVAVIPMGIFARYVQNDG
ncbi:TRAP transporter small permease, partial [Yersinia enterocolitica]